MESESKLRLCGILEEIMAQQMFYFLKLNLVHNIRFIVQLEVMSANQAGKQSTVDLDC